MRTVLVLIVKSTPAARFPPGMMTTMEPANSSDPSPIAPEWRAGLSAAGLTGFLVVASADGALNRFGPLVAIAVALAAGSFLARWVPHGRGLALIGGAVAAATVWLAGQRDDTATVAILAGLFALGTGLAIEPPRPSRRAALAALPAAFAMIVARAVLSQPALIAVVVLVVAGGALATVFGRFPITRSRRAPAIAFGSVLIVATLVFAGYLGAETPAATWFGGGTVHGPANSDQVALTFDDGPNLGATEQIMQILDAHGVKGTFFEVGKAIDAAPQITRTLYDDGQLLGNHSYHHDQWRWLDPSYPELERTQRAFQRAIGTCPVLYRPPHGDRTPFLARVVRDHHMHMVLWSASAGDWATDDAALVARRIVDAARPGGILLLHDGLDGNVSADRSVLVRALPMILEGLRVKGLQPVRLDRLLGTAAYQSC
jgi:peptidoglycan/xylan/chitin deacetylase (PgdA/CDA1 family)